jgi:Flp pilus assembly protein TadG
LLLLLGTIDLGRMFFNYIELRNAVREGAAYASRNPTDSSGAVARVTGHGGLIASANVPAPAMTSGCFTPGGSGTVTMSASQIFTPITTGFLSGFGLGSVNLSASATMRCLT